MYELTVPSVHDVDNVLRDATHMLMHTRSVRRNEVPN